MGQREVHEDDDVPVRAGVLGRTVALLAADQPEPLQRGEIGGGLRLREVGPDSGPDQRAFPDDERVEEPESLGRGDGRELSRGADVALVVLRLDEPRVAVEEVELPVRDRHVPRPSRECTTPT